MSTAPAAMTPRVSPPARTMAAARITAPGRAEMVAVPIPEPAEGQVRIRVRGCGVCGSNIPVWEGRPWFTYPLAPGAPGHEGYGVIDAVGCGASGLREGQRIVALSYSAFAEYDLADASNVVPIPDSAGDQVILGEPLGCAMNIARRSGFAPGQSVAIVGVGFLGALLIQLARREVGASGRIIAISRRADALDIANRCGADAAIPLTDLASTGDAARKLLNGTLCDVVIEAVGLQQPLDLAAELVRERGRLVIAGFHQDGTRQVNMQSWNWRGIDVINAHERDPATFTAGMRRAIQAVDDGTLDPEPLITHRFPLERLGDAMEAARTRPAGFLKAVVTMDAEGASA